MLIRDCAWCKKIYGVKFYINPGKSNLKKFLLICWKNITHWEKTSSICDNCYGLVRAKEIARKKSQEGK